MITTVKSEDCLRYGNRFMIMCQVSGGITGRGIFPLKSALKDSKGSTLIRYFDSLEEAEAEARRLNENAKFPFNSVTRVKYWVTRL